MKKLIVIIFVILTTINLLSQSISPKREFRAAWLATVVNLDWPSLRTLSTASQKLELTKLLDSLNLYGVNTVIFQIRTECDALYSSAIEPWSYWLTNSQGTPPSPFYDPLQFAIDESHKRGMELHAWFNPYRADRSVGSYPKSSSHVTNLHPDWVIQISTFKFLNPGLPAVRNYVSSVIYDVVSRYDIDGVHFDDYFYPYPPNQITNQDSLTFIQYPNGFTNLGNWRRNNVNILIKQVNDTIQSTKPWVKFGISPFGIWKNGVPAGISGLDAYSDIYCDAMTWLKNKSIDYLTPQLYWKFGGGQDYAKLQPWWADSVAKYNLHYYPGHALYRVNPNDGNWSASEIPNQIRFDRSNAKVQGGVFFRTKSFTANYKGVTDTLKNDLYRYKALHPIMSWKDTISPNPPKYLRYETLAGNQIKLIWDLPETATDGDSASRYVIYRFTSSIIQPSDLNNSANIISIEGSRQSTPPIPPNPTGTYYYVVTSLDRNYNESSISNILVVNPLMPVSVLNITVLIEGLFNGTSAISDTVTIQFRNLSSPFSMVEEKRIVLSTTGTGTGAFTLVIEGNLYNVVVKHRNGVETWSKTVQSFNAHALNYNFTTDSSKAYGNNLVKKGNQWCVYSGDVNQDGVIDLSDLSLVDTDNLNFQSGYTVTDLNGDLLIDLSDLQIVDTNNLNFITKIIPALDKTPTSKVNIGNRKNN